MTDDERHTEGQENERWYEDLVLPVLLHAGRMTYGQAIREGYAKAGYDDIPRLGPRLLGGIRRFGGSVGSVGNVARDFGISKQAASKLVDTLVIRGYVERGTDPEDRRRLTLELTERGREAADIGWAAADRIDAELEKAVGAEAIAQMRDTVGALVALGR
jgi:DNA-binding MarR family transcriptional regulator